MASENERLAWAAFRAQMMRDEAAYDGQVPVVLLCVPVCTRGEACHGDVEDNGGVHVDYLGRLATLRPAEVTRHDLILLLSRVLQQLRAQET